MKIPPTPECRGQPRLRAKRPAAPFALAALSAVAAVLCALAFARSADPSHGADAPSRGGPVSTCLLQRKSSANLARDVAEADRMLPAILRIDDAGVQSDALKQLALREAKRDPAALAAWLSRLPAALDRRAAIGEVWRIWAERDPRGAADFALRLPAGELRQSALNALLPAWLARDAGAATAWFDAQEPGADFDGVASTIALLPPLVKKRPEVALSWAESITNADDRRQRIATVIGSWFEREPAAALRYLNDTPALTAFQRLTLKEELGLGEGS